MVGLLFFVLFFFLVGFFHIKAVYNVNRAKWENILDVEVEGF